jgi:hypothetical protein
MEAIFHDWRAQGIDSVLHEKRGGYANNLASLNGLRTYWSSIVLDATAPAGLGFTLSNAFDAKIGDWTYSR